MDQNARLAQCFLAVLEFDSAAPDARAAQTIYANLAGHIDTLLALNGASAQALEHAYAVAYPLVALADECAMRSCLQRATHGCAQPLQVKYFQEHAAGDNFFFRLQHLDRRSAPLDVLYAYYLALALGFRGRHGADEDDAIIAALLGGLHAALSQRGAFSAQSLAIEAHAIAPGAAQGARKDLGQNAPSRPTEQAADDSVWTARRMWHMCGALCVANGMLLVACPTYLRHAAASALQLMAAVTDGAGH